MSKKKKTKRRKTKYALLRLPRRRVQLKLVQIDQQGRQVFVSLPEKGK